MDSFEQSVRSLLSVADDLDPEDWRRPTDLPGWSVHDVVSHLAAVEHELLVGEPPPALATYGAHVRDAFGQHMERGVAARRWRPSDDVVAELRSCLEQRLPQMRAMRADEPPTRVVAGEDWETWVRLLGGRMSPSDAVVEMDGDRGLAQRLVDGLCFTP